MCAIRALKNGPPFGASAGPWFPSIHQLLNLPAGNPTSRARFRRTFQWGASSGTGHRSSLKKGTGQRPGCDRTELTTLHDRRTGPPNRARAPRVDPLLPFTEVKTKVTPKAWHLKGIGAVGAGCENALNGQ